MNGRVGFVGIGQMGAAIARRYAIAGGGGSVFDVDPRKMGAAAAYGLVPYKSLAALAADCTSLVFCLPSPETSASCIHELIAAPGMVQAVIETSTVGCATVRDAEMRLNQANLEFLDAPVSGGPRGATLTSIIAGGGEAKARTLQTVALYSDRIVDCGDEAGRAQTAKLVNNALSLGTLALACEVVAAGVRQGLDLATLVEVINASSGRCVATEEKFARSIVPGTFDHGASIATAEKDMSLFIADCAPESLVPTTHRLLQDWREAGRSFGPDADFTRIFQLAVSRSVS
ncbi:NAD(P)-dependent oxidoreductase [Pararhizobium haloflavum]|uniref:NAD(P)-dependent oxidoreductase n=1 Tax=Pararhizobium haloflavum TaxID=2037914 RepID=UPI000C18A15F|nr:NAD-binding protein [Pararhizobium haloflavum]